MRPAPEAFLTRLRLIVEGERVFETESGTAVVPSAEVRLRHDRGDAETGTGLELGAGLRYTAGALSIEGRVRTLIAHDASGYEEWGASGAIRVNPSQSGRGLTLSIAPQWGRTGSATEELWSAGDARALKPQGSGFEPRGRLAMHAGYGFGLGRGVLTPYAGMTHGDASSRTMRGGAKSELGSNVAVGFEAARSESAGADPTHELRLRAALRF